MALLYACSAYDSKLLGHHDGSFDAATGDGALPDGPDDDASGADSSVGDASNNGCVPSTVELCPEICPETCNGLDDDCDALIDEEEEEEAQPVCTLTDATATCVSGICLIVECTAGASDCDTLPANGCEARLDSPQHCGFCYAACNFPNAVARCDAGTCTFDECLPGFGDCDGLRGNGCERTVNSLDNCGGCNVVCGAVDHGQPGCIDLVCGVSECDTGFEDCDGDASNGCETSLDAVGTCGSCDTVCNYAHATALCAAQMCVPGSCIDGYSDCDSDPLNECEGSLNTDPNNCGACGRVCDPGGVGGFACVAGDCVVTSCTAGFADCDSDASNGCETSTRTLTDCGGCGIACAYPSASASCATGTCTFTACQPGFGNCNSSMPNNGLSDGCETTLDTDANCGVCGSICGASDSRTCSGGVCSLAACPSGSADCDGDGTTCEQSLSSLAHCGACNARCGDTNGQLPNATASCSTASCAVGTCNANFANCDGAAQNGCETSLRTTASCGACGTACSRPNASVSCATGTCAITACNTGFSDCDGNALNGCETATNTNQNCGGCNTTCAQANATTTCSSGSCARVACAAGFGDCDGDVNNGCEVALTSLTHCGACSAACALTNATESCSTGTCSLGSCTTGFGNCDFAASNGCETQLNSTSNCNGCGALCDYANSTESCATGSCTLTGCSSGYANCDNDESNGCEQSLSTSAHCGGCNVTCSRANASATCSTGTCTIGVCNTGFGNCDGDAANGCETPLGTTTNCGACGDVCGGGKPCENFACRGSFPYTTSNFDGNDGAIVPVGAATLSCGVSTFNSTTLAFGNWCGQPMPTPIVRTQSGGPDVVILAFDAFTMSNGATLQLTGNRPVILAVYGDATINGTIDASGSGITPGAGGNWSCGTSAGGNGAGSCNVSAGGGGGGGHATNGAVGGTSAAPGTAGLARGTANDSPLLGGCNGGNGGGCATIIGGGGGGALQLSAAGVLTLGATGRVLATGGSGLIGGCGCNDSGGGGGGSGGAVLLEGNTVTTASGATITANGGKGGNGQGSDGGIGGNGGTGTTAPVTPNNSGSGGGGGGGAIGRGFIRGVTGCSLAHSSSISLAVGGVCVLPPPPPSPPSGSTCNLFAYGGHNYFFCNETTRHWNQARTQCQSIGFDLVRVNDGGENAFLLSHLTVAQPYALGGSDFVTPDRWVWVIGDAHFWQGVQNGSAQNGLYTNWAVGEPNGANPDEDFAYIINGSGTWNDDDSNPNRPFICESL